VAKTKHNGTTMNVARIVCISIHGEPPSLNYDAAHSCGKAHEGCVNPKHISWKTKSENQYDRIIHGTALFGFKNHRAKLSDADVSMILSLQGVHTQKEIARQFNVSRQHVGNIFAGRKRARHA
jgi:hypothetical protein